MHIPSNDLDGLITHFTQAGVEVDQLDGVRFSALGMWRRLESAGSMHGEMYMLIGVTNIRGNRLIAKQIALVKGITTLLNKRMTVLANHLQQTAFDLFEAAQLCRLRIEQ
ncbi:hypothetical protein PMIN06_002458 [Paraphaeosphaeria minitans]